MPGRALLDTTIVIAYRAAEQSVVDRVESLDAAYVSAVTVGELAFGAHKSARPARQMEWLEDFTRSVAILPCDAGTAYQYGMIRDALRRKGRPIPENDLWISAIALQHSLPLATR